MEYFHRKVLMKFVLGIVAQWARCRICPESLMNRASTGAAAGETPLLAVLCDDCGRPRDPDNKQELS
jgi:hypothetical protein